MELRILIDDCGEQFAGISRDYLCDFQDGVQYQFPYLFRCGQFESASGGFPEECSECLVGLKALHRAKDIVLHHRQREAGNLGCEVDTLALAEAEQLLAVAICHLGSPTGSVRPVCLEEAEREVCGEQSVPLSLPSAFREEQADGGAGKLHVNGTVGALERPAVLGKSLLLEFCDNLIGCQVAPLGVVPGLAQLNHAYQMTLDVAAGDEFHEVSTGEPTVNEQIVEADTALDGILYHLDGLVGLFHRILPDALFDALSRIVGCESLSALLVSQPLLLAWPAAFFPMKREVEEQLTHAIAQQQRKTLVTKDTLMLDMGEYPADEFTLATTLRSVCVINNQADRLVVLDLRPTADLANQLEIHSIQQLAPFDIAIIHKTIEHVLLATEQAT